MRTYFTHDDVILRIELRLGPPLTARHCERQRWCKSDGKLAVTKAGPAGASNLVANWARDRIKSRNVRGMICVRRGVTTRGDLISGAGLSHCFSADRTFVPPPTPPKTTVLSRTSNLRNLKLGSRKLRIMVTVTIRYDTRCYFNVRSKADISQLNLPHGTDN